MTMYSFFRTGSPPSSMPTTFSPWLASLLIATFKLSFFSALSSNESCLVPAPAP